MVVWAPDLGGPPNIQVQLSDGTGFGPPTFWNQPSGINASPDGANLIVDVDGDGDADLIRWGAEGGLPNIQVQLSDGTSFGEPTFWNDVQGDNAAAAGANLIGNFDGQ